MLWMCTAGGKKTQASKQEANPVTVERGEDAQTAPAHREDKVSPAVIQAPQSPSGTALHEPAAVQSSEEARS